MPVGFDALPDHIRDDIVGAYNDALTPVFAMLIAGLALVIFIKEVPLRASLDTVVEDEGEPTPFDAVAEGAVVSGPAAPWIATGPTDASAG